MNRRGGGPVRPDDTEVGAGDGIRARRQERGMSQQRLADIARVSRQTVVAMERGDYAPSVYLALRIARALGTDVESLWGRSTEAEPAVPGP